jgi:diaminopimelate decarboxylase
MNPANDFTYDDGALCAEAIPFQQLAARYSTPLYVYSQRSIISRCRQYENALDDFPHLTYYAVKANANRTILRLVAGEGLGADVGSRGELYLAREAGFSPSSITFSGVGKRDDEIEYALAENIRAFNVESKEEIEVLNEIAGRMNQRARMLVRANLDIDAGGHAYISTSKRQNKFGIPHHEVPALLRWAASLPSIEIQGVHSHIGSQITNGETFARAAQALVDLVRELRHGGLTITDLDFGGGFGVQYRGFLSDPRLPVEEPEEPGLSISSLIKGIVPILRESGCTVSIQPGRSIVAQAGVLLVRVLYRKETADKRFLITDGAMNDLIRPSLYHAHHQIVPVLLTGAPHETVDVVGPVCESGDFFALDRPIPRVQRGDLLAIMCAGAYGYVLASNYNARLRPAEVLIGGETATLIRERERFEDL